MQRDRYAGLVAIVEIVALEHLRDRRLREQLHEVGEAERVEPFGVVAHLDALEIEHLAGLLAVGLHVRFDLFARELRPRHVAPARIADARRKVADDQRHAMAGLGETLKRMQHDHEAEMQVGARRIDAEFHVQRPPGLKRSSKSGAVST